MTGWRVVGASSVGTSHRSVQRGCDDAFASRICRGDRLVVAVADGAGSAAHSAIGARYAVEWAVETACRCLEPIQDATNEQLEGVIREAFASARDHLLDIHELGGPTPAELAATLIVTIAADDLVAAGQVGDGAVVLRMDEDVVEALTRPERFEYLNQTIFITSDGAMDALSIAITAASPTQFAVMTDGLQALAFDLATDEPFEPFFLPMFAFGEGANSSDGELLRFLDSDRVNEGTDDDKTIVVATRIA